MITCNFTQHPTIPNATARSEKHHVYQVMDHQDQASVSIPRNCYGISVSRRIN